MRLACAFAVALLLIGCGKPPAPVVEKVEAQAAAPKELEFTTKFYDAANKWVVFKTQSYLAGFLYIDPEAGFTFQPEAEIAIANNGLEKRKDYSDLIIKHRLGENTVDVAVLSEKEIEQLGFPKEPDWLKFYKKDENSNLVGMGFSYNHIGASHKAIEPLLKVYNREPHFKGVEFELAYAYNATESFDKAVDVLDKAIKNDPQNSWFYKELGYALIHQNKLEEAEKVYLKGIEMVKGKEYQAEMANNMAYNYFLAKNKPKFKEWAERAKKYADKKSKIYYHMIYLEENWE